MAQCRHPDHVDGGSQVDTMGLERRPGVPSGEGTTRAKKHESILMRSGAYALDSYLTRTPFGGRQGEQFAYRGPGCSLAQNERALVSDRIAREVGRLESEQCDGRKVRITTANFANCFGHGRCSVLAQNVGARSIYPTQLITRMIPGLNRPANESVEAEMGTVPFLKLELQKSRIPRSAKFVNPTNLSTRPVARS
jgi:hypothetical protein